MDVHYSDYAILKRRVLLFPLNAAFITYGPILISALYYDPPLVRMTTLVSWISYGLLMWANVVLESRNETMTAIHAAQSVSLWKSPMEVLLYRHVPHTVFFVVTAIICVGIAKGGKKLVLNKAEITSEKLIMDEELRLASDIQVSPCRTVTSEALTETFR